MDKVQHVSGRNCGKILLYALSTCIWCRKTKNLLAELGVAFDYIDVDLLTGQAQLDVSAELQKWNPNHSFPTLVVDDSKCILGFNESEIRETLNNGKP